MNQPNPAKQAHQRILRRRMGFRLARGGWWRQCRWCSMDFRPGLDTRTWNDRYCCPTCKKAGEIVWETIKRVGIREREAARNGKKKMGRPKK